MSGSFEISTSAGKVVMTVYDGDTPLAEVMFTPSAAHELRGDILEAITQAQTDALDVAIAEAKALNGRLQ